MRTPPVRGRAAALATALSLALLATTAGADPAAHQVDRAHSKIGFKAYTKLFDVEGRFKRWSADAMIDPEDVTRSKVRITVLTKSVDTDNDGRDDHLRNEDFFHTSKYPRATFVSKKIVRHGEGSFEVEGDLNIRGVKKRVRIPFQWTEVARKKRDGSPYMSRRARGQLRVVRQDFNIDYKAAFLMPSIDDEVDIFFDVNFFIPPSKSSAKSAKGGKSSTSEKKRSGGW